MPEHVSLKTPAERLNYLESLLSGARSSTETRLSRRLRMNRTRNLLFGVALHAAARQAAGKPLTDLEQRLLGRMSKVIPPEEFPALGERYAAARARGAISLFPEPIAGLSLEQGYSDADLRAALPALGRELMAQPNFSEVDLSKLGAGDSLDTEAFSAALAEYGCGMTLVTGAPLDEAARAAPLNVKVRMASFKCERSSGDGMFNSKDEIYWGISAGSDTEAQRSSNTREYGSIEDGSHPSFDSGTYLFSGTVQQHMGCEIQCWEADDSNGSFYSSLRSALADFAENAVEQTQAMLDQGQDAERAGWVALMGFAASLLDALLGLVTNDDDLVCERTIGFDRAALHAFSNRGEDWWIFDGGGGGRHKLYLSFDNVETQDRRLYHSVLKGNTWTESIALPSGTTGHRPALAAYNGKLNGMVRGEGNEGLYHATFNGTAWTSFSKLGGEVASPEAPALAEFKGKLYSMHRGANDAHLYWHFFNGASWSASQALPGPTKSVLGVSVSLGTAKGPALAVYEDALYCVTRALTVSGLYWTAFNGTSWTPWALVGSNVTSAEAPALAEFNGKLYCVWRGDSGGYLLYWSAFNGTSWSAASPFPSGSTSESPALAAFEGKLYCMVRGRENESLYHATFQGSSWSSFTQSSLTSSTTPAVAVFNQTLYCVHRG
jgi:hypothetical protein